MISDERRAMEAETQRKVESLTRDLIDEINVMGMEKTWTRGVTRALVETHRTLQQATIASLLAVLLRWHETAGQDLRNEYAHRLVEVIQQALEARGMIERDRREGPDAGTWFVPAPFI